jgi:DnaJ-class molecular chaperone
MLGGTVDVPTLSGSTVTLKVGPGTQPDQKVVMRGKGIKSLRNTSKGNQYVIFKVHTLDNPPLPLSVPTSLFLLCCRTPTPDFTRHST